MSFFEGFLPSLPFSPFSLLCLPFSAFFLPVVPFSSFLPFLSFAFCRFAWITVASTQCRAWWGRPSRASAIDWAAGRRRAKRLRARVSEGGPDDGDESMRRVGAGVSIIAPAIERAPAR